MGAHLADILSLQGHDLVITTRKDRQDTEHVKYIIGDAHDNEFLQRLMSENWEAIVDFMVYNTVEFKKRIDCLLSSTQQYIYLSSARVFANEDIYITERSPRLLDMSKDKEYLQTDEYALTKARQENILRESGKYNWTIVRPYITFSEMRLQLGVYEKENWLYRALHGRPIVFSRDISQHYTTLTYGKDVARGIAGLVGNKKAFGEDFNIVTEEFYSWQEILDLYVDTLEKCIGHRPNVFYLDDCLNLKFERTRYQVEYCRLFDRRFDNSKILSVVSDLEFGDTRVLLRYCLQDIVMKLSFKPIGIMWEALLDRASGEYTLPAEFHHAKRYLKYLLFREAPFTWVKYIVNHK